MATGTTRRTKDTAGGAVLRVAFELDDLRWKLGIGAGELSGEGIVLLGPGP